jgi:hypothetical protein
MQLGKKLILVIFVAYFKHLRNRKIFLTKFSQAIAAGATQITSTYT